MRAYTLTHLSDAVLLRDLARLVAQDRITTATLLAHIAEVDARRLYVPAGYSSMHAYCVDELGLSEDSASKRIQAARAAHRFPVLFTALAEGRLHLSAVWLLAPHLTEQNLDELLEAASHRRKAEIEALLARRFSPRDVPTIVRALRPSGHVGSGTLALSGSGEHALGHVEEGPSASAGVSEHAPGHVEGERSASAGSLEHALGHVEDARATERYLLQVTIDKGTREKLRQAQALLSHAIPSGDVALVLDRALEALIVQLEKRKVGAVARLPQQRQRARTRYIPAPVRREVWERDQGQCTFNGASGHRCEERRFLEFDHVNPFARGGRATVEGIRLRCRPHNQYEAERAFGADFMNRKRQSGLVATANAQARATAQNEAAKAEAAKGQAQDVLAGLRGLGFRADEARRAAAFSETCPNATLEDRMRSALRFLGQRSTQGRAPGKHHVYS